MYGTVMIRMRSALEGFMKHNGYLFDIDCVSKFYNSIYVRGWFYHESETLVSVGLNSSSIKSNVSHVGTPHGGVTNLGPNLGFDIQVLRGTTDFDEAAELTFSTSSGNSFSCPLLSLADQAAARGKGAGITPRFQSMLSGKMLDIGGRDRSGLDRSTQYPGIDVTVLDIVPGDNVDVVGDAHNLSAYFPPNHFDAVLSVSVFEHLLMPWKAVIEINKVLKRGGIGMVHTHQTLGMHDLPWDFWRFSDTAWKALFNEGTGFEIVDVALDSPQYVVPFYFSMGKNNAERSAGFESSSVIFRKIGECQERWITNLQDIESSSYPTGDDEMARQIKAVGKANQKSIIKRFLRF